MLTLTTGAINNHGWNRLKACQHHKNRKTKQCSNALWIIIWNFCRCKIYSVLCQDYNFASSAYRQKYIKNNHENANFDIIFVCKFNVTCALLGRFGCNMRALDLIQQRCFTEIVSFAISGFVGDVKKYQFAYKKLFSVSDPPRWAEWYLLW